MFASLAFWLALALVALNWYVGGRLSRAITDSLADWWYEMARLYRRKCWRWWGK